MVYQKVCKKKYLSWEYGVYRKICHSGSLFGITRQAFKTTASMVLKFYMQVDEVAGLRNNKIQPGQESKIAAVAKIAKPLKLTFSPKPLYIFG